MKRCPESGSAKDVSEDFPMNDCNLVDRKESTYQSYRHFHIDNRTLQRVSSDMISCVCVNMILFLCTVRLSGATADTFPSRITLHTSDSRVTITPDHRSLLFFFFCLCSGGNVQCANGV